MLRRAVFLDKDNTLIPDMPYQADPTQMALLPDVPEGLRLLHAAGFLLIVVTNQSGVARGHFPESALLAVEARLRSLFDSVDVPLTGFYFCPHHPEGIVPRWAIECYCRKPKPGMLLRAAYEHNLNLSASWMIGDKADDVYAGRDAGCRAIQIVRHSELLQAASFQRRVPTLLRASQSICERIDDWSQMRGH